MRTSNFGKGRRVAVLFRLCLAIIVLLTLAAGGMALNTQPVRALDIVPAPPANFPVVECQPFTYTFANDGIFACAGPGYIVYYWLWGMLPLDSTWNMTTGVLTACPRLGSSTAVPGGVYNFWVSAVSMDSFGCWDFGPAHPCSITVTAGGIIPPLAITPTWYPVAWEGLPFTMTLAATGCSGAYSWGATGLPVGLTLNAGTGVISGIPGPGTCGSWTVTVTVTDTGMCPSAGCCPPVSAPFTLIVDCLANYTFITYYTTACDFDVAIGTGLTQGQTEVLIDGSYQATLGGGQSETFTSQPCESHLVIVNQTVQGSDPNTRFSVIGSNQKMVTDTDNYAYFDYRQEVTINTGSAPPGIYQPPNAGLYAIGDIFSTTAPSPVPGPEGTRYVFGEWRLPDGSTDPNRDVCFNVNRAGSLTAMYETYYELILRSDYPAVEDSTWHPEGSTATWDHLALHEVPMEGLLGFLGGSLVPKDIGGGHVMDAPYTHELQWGKNYWWPIIIILLILAVIAGVFYFIYRLKTGPTRPPTKPERAAPKKRPLQPKAKASRTTTRTGAQSKAKPRAATRTGPRKASPGTKRKAK